MEDVKVLERMSHEIIAKIADVCAREELNSWSNPVVDVEVVMSSHSTMLESVRQAAAMIAYGQRVFHIREKSRQAIKHADWLPTDILGESITETGGRMCEPACATHLKEIGLSGLPSGLKSLVPGWSGIGFASEASREPNKETCSGAAFAAEFIHTGSSTPCFRGTNVTYGGCMCEPTCRMDLKTIFPFPECAYPVNCSTGWIAGYSLDSESRIAALPSAYPTAAAVRPGICYSHVSVGGYECEPARGNRLKEIGRDGLLPSDSRCKPTMCECWEASVGMHPFSAHSLKSRALSSLNGTEHLNISRDARCGQTDRKLLKKVFVSYAHENRALCELILQQLRILEWRKWIAAFCDGMIVPGREIDDELLARLYQADIILLLISSAFLDSEYCRREMAIALELYHAGRAEVIPIILEPVCEWQDMEIGKLLAIPPDGTPINSYEDVYLAMEEFARGLLRAVRAPSALSAERPISDVNDRPAIRRSGHEVGLYYVTISGADPAQEEQLLRALRKHARDDSLTLQSIEEIE